MSDLSYIQKLAAAAKKLAYSPLSPVGSGGIKKPHGLHQRNPAFSGANNPLANAGKLPNLNQGFGNSLATARQSAGAFHQARNQGGGSNPMVRPVTPGSTSIGPLQATLRSTAGAAGGTLGTMQAAQQAIQQSQSARASGPELGPEFGPQPKPMQFDPNRVMPTPQHDALRSNYAAAMAQRAAQLPKAPAQAAQPRGPVTQPAQPTAASGVSGPNVAPLDQQMMDYRADQDADRFVRNAVPGHLRGADREYMPRALGLPPFKAPPSEYFPDAAARRLGWAAPRSPYFPNPYEHGPARNSLDRDAVPTRHVEAGPFADYLTGLSQRRGAAELPGAVNRMLDRPQPQPPAQADPFGAGAPKYPGTRTDNPFALDGPVPKPQAAPAPAPRPQVAAPPQPALPANWQQQSAANQQELAQTGSISGASLEKMFPTSAPAPPQAAVAPRPQAPAAPAPVPRPQPQQAVPVSIPAPRPQAAAAPPPQQAPAPQPVNPHVQSPSDRPSPPQAQAAAPSVAQQLAAMSPEDQAQYAKIKQQNAAMEALTAKLKAGPSPEDRQRLMQETTSVNHLDPLANGMRMDPFSQQRRRAAYDFNPNMAAELGLKRRQQEMQASVQNELAREMPKHFAPAEARGTTSNNLGGAQVTNLAGGGRSPSGPAGDGKPIVIDDAYLNQLKQQKNIENIERFKKRYGREPSAEEYAQTFSAEGRREKRLAQQAEREARKAEYAARNPGGRRKYGFAVKLAQAAAKLGK